MRKFIWMPAAIPTRTRVQLSAIERENANIAVAKVTAVGRLILLTKLNSRAIA